MILTTITAIIAAQIYDTLLEKGKDFFIDKGMNGMWDFLVKNKGSFETEITKIANDSMASYEVIYPHNPDDEKLPFYKSQTVLLELLNFSFTNELNIESVQNAINSDIRVSVPTSTEINELLKIFHEKISSNKKLRGLFIKENYQKEIFKISEKVSRLHTNLETHIIELKDNFKQLTAPDLSLEWSKQLDEIKEDYRMLKHRTAKSRVIKLRQRMMESGFSDKVMLARTISILTDCSAYALDKSESIEVNKLHIQAYNLVPTSNEYKEKAAMAYLVLEEEQKAVTLAKDLLAVNEYDVVAWIVLCYADGTKMTFIENKVPQLVRNDKTFQLNIINKLMSQHRFNEIETLLKSGYSFLEIEEVQPDSVSFRNLTYWSVWCTVATVLYLSGKKEFKNSSIQGDAYDISRIKKIQTVLTKVIHTIKDTEIESDFMFLKFQHLYLRLLVNFNDKDLQALVECHNHFKASELNYSITFQLIRALASSQKQENLKTALEIIDKHPERDSTIFLLFKISHFSEQDEIEIVSKLVDEYYAALIIIDELNVANILQLFSLHYENYPDAAINQIRRLANEKPATNQGFMKLLIVNADIAEESTDALTLKSNIESLASDLQNEPYYIKNIVARFFITAKLFSEAYRFLSSYVEKEVINETSLLYFDVLFNLPNKRVELKHILSQLKTANLRFPKKIVEYDRAIAKAEYDFDSLKDICIYGLQFYPDATILIYDLFISLNHLKDKKGIADNVPLLENFDYTIDDAISISICEILIINGFKDESLELMYKLASNKQNTRFREYYVSKLLTSEVLSTEPPKEVEISTYVSYSIDGKNHSVEITKDNLETNLVIQLIGKVVNEEFVYTHGLRAHKVTIVEILDKHRTLLKSIMKDTENPLNGFGIQQFSIDKDSDESGPEQIINQLIENFGPQEEIRTQQLQAAFEQYYNNELPFALVTRQIFRDNAIDAYLYFSSDQSKALSIPPSYFYRDLMPAKENTFIFDIPSAVLLYQLDRDYNLKLKDCKLAIPNTAGMLLDKIVSEVKSDRGSIGNFRISTDGIKSTFYTDDYQSQRIEHIEGIASWIREHFKIIPVTERLEALPDLNHELLSDVYMQTLLDNLLLSHRPEYNLVTSDTSYFSFLHGDAREIISIESFLNLWIEEENQPIVYSILINKNLVGIKLPNDALKNHLIDRMAGKKNKYAICLENLAIAWNETTNVAAAISHVKWILTTPTLPDGLKLISVEEVFRAMIPGIHANEAAKKLVISEMSRQFTLLDNTIHETAVYCLKNALKYFGNGGNQ